jgi:hypothetical protein
MEASHPGSRKSGQASIFQRLLESSGEDCLRAACDGLRRALGDGREEHGAAFDPDELGRQIAGLHAWAAQAGLLIPAADLPPLVKGGREHSLVQTRDYLSRIVKVTIGPEFGFYAACLPQSQYRDVCHWFTTVEALPSQYFRRLLLLNGLFPRCHTRLAGFVWSGTRLHAVTAQLIAQGRPASLHEITSWLQGLGYHFISAWTWFHPGKRCRPFRRARKERHALRRWRDRALRRHPHPLRGHLPRNDAQRGSETGRNQPGLPDVIRCEDEVQVVATSLF